MGRIRECNKFDYIKGILVFCVIYGHTSTYLSVGFGMPTVLHVIIRFFDMPFFAFISGYFLYSSLSKHNVLENIKNKFLNILFPVLLWNSLLLIPSAIKHSQLDISSFLNGFWFLYSIFFSLIILILVSCIKKKLVRNIIIFLILVIFHSIIIDIYKIGFILFFTVFGFIYKENEQQLNSFLQKNIYYMTVIWIGMLCFWDPNYNIWNLGCNAFKNIDSCICILFRGIIGIFGIMVSGYYLGKAYDLPFGNYERICEFGRNSLEIYIVQSIIVERIFSKLFYLLTIKMNINLLIKNIAFFQLIIVTVVSLITIALINLVVKIIYRTPIFNRFLFGVKLQ